MTQPKIGLLPLYVELYDRVLPELRGKVLPLVQQVAEQFQAQGVAVTCSPVCCVRDEVAAALKLFEKNQVDLVVTLHLAYSPSLEAADLLAGTALPILMLDTTPAASFPRDVNPEQLLYNHGIHGVQDLAAMLRRRKKDYEVIAGHLSDPTVMRRAVELARAARAAHALRGMRALCIGGAFAGMGDFRVEPAVLRTKLGITAATITPEELGPFVEKISEAEVEAERQLDLRNYRAEISPEVHRRSLRLGLGLRRCLAQGNYGAFSMNFDAFRSSEGPVNTVPFLECCKAMARGVGFAGEGDVLTAALVAALAAGYGMTSFIEMFCPDWAGDAAFFSHMGEFNPELSAEKPLLFEKDYTLSPALNPAALSMAPRPGPATYVNLTPGPDDSFRLIVTKVEVLEDGTHPDIKKWVRGWFRPQPNLAAFLEQFSRLGGTHHSALILGDHVESLLCFARLIGAEGCRI